MELVLRFVEARGLASTALPDCFLDVRVSPGEAEEWEEEEEDHDDSDDDDEAAGWSGGGFEE